MFDGYWGQHAAGSPRWHETDDLGYLDAEGYLHLVSRRSDSVRSGGVSFALSDLRRHIMSLPGVVEVELAVESDDRLGERVRASVIAAAGSGHSVDSITQQLRSTLRDTRMLPSELEIICS
jgi:long-chain acyl-CoA synthetase